MLSKVLSASFIGVEGYIIEVEVDISNGLPIFNIVGLGDMAINESKERVKASIKNSGYDFSPKRVVVNLSPAHIRKEGSSFDLPIALGILIAFGMVSEEKAKDYVVLGELSLGGEVNRVTGIINAVITSKENGIKGVIVPYENYLEAKMIQGVDIVPVRNLKELIAFYNDNKRVVFEEKHSEYEEEVFHDFSEVKGQYKAKRAMEIAAAGGHNLFMIGSPGSGKSMLAKRLPTILPKMAEDEIIECTKIFSIAGLLNEERSIITKRPFRTPHHTASNVSIIGGGRIPKPGEITLAHNGVLFLDEMNEFPKQIVETLRQPLEDKEISLSRAMYRVKFPSDFILIGASNPCKCGNHGDDRGRPCTCSEKEVKNYMGRISGPILDRMDLYIEIKRLTEDELLNHIPSESSKEIRNRVEKSRLIQRERFGKTKTNSQMSQKELKEYCVLGMEEKELIKRASERMGLSARSFDKILKVSRTIADLEEAEKIDKVHILEALSFRKNN